MGLSKGQWHFLANHNVSCFIFDVFPVRTSTGGFEMSNDREAKRNARTALLCSLNAYEGLLEQLISSREDPQITVRIIVKRYNASLYEAFASELFQPNVVELRAKVEAQITKLRSELQDLI